MEVNFKPLAVYRSDGLPLSSVVRIKPSPREFLYARVSMLHDHGYCQTDRYSNLTTKEGDTYGQTLRWY